MTSHSEIPLPQPCGSGLALQKTKQVIWFEQAESSRVCLVVLRSSMCLLGLLSSPVCTVSFLTDLLAPPSPSPSWYIQATWSLQIFEKGRRRYVTSDITVWLHTKDAPGWEKTLGSWRGGGEDSNPTFHTSLSQFTALTTKRPFMLLVLVHAKGSLDVIWAPTKILIMYNSIWKRELLCPRNFARALR